MPVLLIANHIDGTDFGDVLEPLAWAIEAAAASGEVS